MNNHEGSARMACVEKLTCAAIVKNNAWGRNGNFDPDSKSRNNDDSLSTRDTLKNAWTTATKALELNCSQELLDEWFEKLWRLHTESTRLYHTAVHLEEMFHYFYLICSLADNTKDYPADSKTEVGERPVIAMAVFFHDAIYVAKSSTNEEDSAKLFDSFASEAGISSPIKEMVLELIVATKKHEVSAEMNTTVLSLFLDLDMAVLGKVDQAYGQYASLIRQEYSFVPHDVYCAKRADVLETFLKQPRIYGTSLMYNALEDRARANLRNEIEALRRGVTPGGCG